MDLCPKTFSLRPTWVVAATIATAAGCGSAAGRSSPPAAAEAHRDQFGTLTPQQLWQWLKDGRSIHVFDNNRPETYALGRVPGAIALALGEVSADRLPADKSATLVFYCSNEH